MAKPIEDWQVKCNDIGTRMTTLHQTGSWTDCVFLFGNGKLVPSHKLVLASASPVFATMFFGGMPESGASIRVDDIQPATFISMLKYIYTDVTDISSYEDACALYYAANKYMLIHLQEQCTDYLVENLTATHCCLAIEFAQVFDVKELLRACQKIIEKNAMDVLNSDGFLTASLSTIKLIYSWDPMANTSELDLFQALERYVAARKEKSGESNKKNNEIGNSEQKEPENKSRSPVLGNEKTIHAIIEDSNDKEQVTIRDIVKLIRFRTMSAQEFARGPALSPLLTQSEIISIFIKLNDNESKLPVPENLSSYREDRNYLIRVMRGEFRHL